MKHFVILTLHFVTVANLPAGELTVLPKKIDGQPTKQMMKRYLMRLAYQSFDARTNKYEALKTAEQIQKYQEELRAFFIERIGGFPKKTPLNAKIVGRMLGDGCRIEKIIYESSPQHYVTATMFLPMTSPPYPAILIPCGHTVQGKSSNQRLGMFFAQNGLAALSYDPIGQGERFQLLTKEGKPRFGPTTEHTMLGIGSILVGRNTASYRIWDGIRSLDYLQSRKDIDGKRLGCTGVSGGGTLTEYLMALDPRIIAAAPACAPMTFKRRFETIGPGDAEQNIFGQVLFGLDHGDYTILRAPKPTLLLTATQDFVDIKGAWDLFRETKRIYTRLGFPEKVSLIEADAKHGFSKPLRIGAVRWMRRWLLNKHDFVNEPEIKTLPYDNVLCTPKGQVQLMKDARSVMDLNMDAVKKYTAQRKKLWSGPLPKALAKVRELTGIRPHEKIVISRISNEERLDQKTYIIEKLRLVVHPAITIPGLMYRPKNASGERILYLNGLGKHVDAGSNGPIESLVKKGHEVLAIDMRGIGETGISKPNQWGGDFDDIFMAYLLGKSFVSMRAEDVIVMAEVLARWVPNKKLKPVRVIAVGAAGPPALHAVALERNLFSHLTLRKTTTSWLPVVRDPALKGQLIHAVHGALKYYDLADLIRSLPKKMVTIE